MPFKPITRTELSRRANAARAALSACRLCPRECRIDRRAGRRGRCGMDARVRVASHNLHFGEEPPISGHRGSGTIFFSGCPLSCLFCQNFPISQRREGREVEIEELAAMMLELQERGAHNLNLVTPTHYVPQFLEALVQARGRGFRLPIVYNSSGYESLETLAWLEGVVAVYLPDLKYGDDAAGRELSGVDDYFTRAGRAIREIFRQAGPLRTDREGVAVSGVILRHLVLPDNLARSDRVLRFLARAVSTKLTVSLMSQYFPAHRAAGYPQLARRLEPAEYMKLVKLAKKLGFQELFIQEITDS
ncbi:MAG TPA: radical SAM protein [bacterium]|uniref:Radical SAM superfamily protein n=1 Tax=candidate division TA06 bacterium ADurb.Bin417 TaxID=1852828 RepID=A0A1V5MFL1_UNCT6|nr:MAG: Radical SAM superfamily protein [candidate division TA06 bacterium ADurb.Bin417]HNQ34991.1 radical SAM protein [bacterium]HNS49346.1 radical SAM protein [bacterium]